MPRKPENKVRVTKNGRLYLSHPMVDRLLGRSHPGEQASGYLVVQVDRDAKRLSVRPSNGSEDKGSPRTLLGHLGGSGFVSVIGELHALGLKLPAHSVTVTHRWRGTRLTVELGGLEAA